MKKNKNKQKTKLDFFKKIVCITGAGSGIGKATAEAFAERGAYLILVSKNKNVLGVTKLLSKKTPVLSFQGDVSDCKFVKSFVKKTIKKWKAIDVLINAAGIIGPIGLLPENNIKKWIQTIQVNLIGTYLTMHEILPSMISRKKGKIINFAGGGAAYSYPRFTSYASSKVAIVRLTETVAEEVAPYNIQVNVIAPGAVETNTLKKVRAAGGEVRTVVTMDKPVNLLLFLASNFSDHITGRFIHSKDDYWNFSKDIENDLYKLRRLPF